MIIIDLVLDSYHGMLHRSPMNFKSESEGSANLKEQGGFR